MMKTLLIAIATIITLNLSAQDCNSPDNLTIISGNVGFVRDRFASPVGKYSPDRPKLPRTGGRYLVYSTP